MKKHFLIMLLISQLALLTNIYAQNIAINGNGNQPDTSAMLDVSSSNKGFLAPRMTTAQQNAIPLPANGLLIFNTTDNVFKVNTGTTVAPVWTSLATGSGAITNTLGSSTNTITSTVNGVVATAPLVNSVSNTSSANNLTTTVNGVAATAVPMINTNALSISGSNLTSTINGVASNALTLPFLTSLNTLTGASQTFATGSTGADFAISSSGSVHTFNLPDAAAAARGVVSTGTQTFAGNKTFSGTITASSLAGGASTDSLVTTDATGVLKKRTIASVVAGNVWGTFGNSPVNSGNMFFGSVNNASLRFRSFNVERMVLDSVGNVGFGIAVPLKPIDIVCNLPSQGGVMQFRNSAVDGYTSIDLQNEAGTQVGNVGWGNTSASAPYANSFYFSSNVAAPMLFLTTSTERMRILAGGNIGIGITAPTAVLHLKGGTATAGSASFKINDGTLLSTIEKGAIEKDANVFYSTPDANNRGLLPSVSYSVLSADFTLANSNTAQAVFSSGQDNINVTGSTTYEFEAQYILTTGTTTHTTATLFAGTASYTGISYVAELSSGAANTLTTTISKTNANAVTAVILNATSTNAETVIQLKGIMRINNSGTLIPQIKFSAAPGGTNKCLVNSYFKLTPIGTNTVSKIGSWF